MMLCSDLLPFESRKPRTSTLRAAAIMTPCDAFPDALPDALPDASGPLPLASPRFPSLPLASPRFPSLPLASRHALVK
jgi:hypothetical protein